MILNRTGRWYLTVMNISENLGDSEIASGDMVSEDKILKFADSYSLRTWTSGCYFYHETTKAWVATGMEIRETMYGATHCRSDHLTSFATGFFVITNSVEFDYIFAHDGFEDRLTIYLTIIVTAIMYLLLSMWAR